MTTAKLNKELENRGFDRRNFKVRFDKKIEAFFIASFLKQNTPALEKAVSEILTDDVYVVYNGILLNTN